jgi:hypothetical protein
MVFKVPDDGASGMEGLSGHHPFGWRDAMDIIVKWRQLCEPNDQVRLDFGGHTVLDSLVTFVRGWGKLLLLFAQVVWVDLLTRAEFEAGFGSHTPMFTGQTKCVRYYMNFERAMKLFKDILLHEGHAFDAKNKPGELGERFWRCWPLLCLSLSRRRRSLP